MEIGTSQQVGNGHTVRFWIDRWVGQCAMGLYLNWIANNNGFIFECSTILELVDIDAYIPMRDSNLVEVIRGAVIWSRGWEGI